MTLSREWLPDHLGTKLVIACHDELVIECPITGGVRIMLQGIDDT